MPAAIGYEFTDPDLFQLALAHRSWCAENDRARSNERLEFLGDAVLGLVVADTIYSAYPELPEGQLAKLRAGVVNAATLADVARDIGLGEHLLLGKGEQATGGADKQSILADALEAILGAVYLDGGFDAARSVIGRLWASVIAETARSGPGGFDHKTRLQEMAVALDDHPPEYRVETQGPDHARVFLAKVWVGSELYGTGAGSSKKEAEQAAAGEAVEAVEALHRAAAMQRTDEAGESADSERRAS